MWDWFDILIAFSIRIQKCLDLCQGLIVVAHKINTWNMMNKRLSKAIWFERFYKYKHTHTQTLKGWIWTCHTNWLIECK